MTRKVDLEAVRAGDRIALARCISQVEDQTTAGRQALSALFPFTGQAHLIGITGSPGTGKSTLTAQLARAFRQPRSGDKPSTGGYPGDRSDQPVQRGGGAGRSGAHA